MILPTLITTLFLASALLTTAASAASLLTNKYDCQTPDNAPNVDEVRWTIDYLKGIGNRKCKQDNGLGSKCTKVAWHGTANISICGNYGRYVKCQKAVEEIETMIRQCQRNGLVGGYIHMDNKFRIAIHR